MTLRTCSILTLLFAFMCIPAAAQEVVTFENSWAAPGINLTSQSTSGVSITYSMPFIHLNEMGVNGEVLKKVSMPGSFLPNNEGAPDLPGMSRFIAIPQGASVSYQIVNSRMQVIENIDILPAAAIPLDNDDSPPVYEKDMAIYGQNAFYPAEPVQLSAPTQLRGMDVVMLGITPFTYNPVEKTLVVYSDYEIKVTFHGGNGQFGDNAYRSRWFEPLFKQNLINYATLPSVNFDSKPASRAADECEYMIFIPDDPDFETWANVIKDFRVKQGISTNIFNIADYGGTATGIKNKLSDAYYNWGTKPVAVMMLGDLPMMPTLTYSGYGTVLTDNKIADMTGNNLPDVNIARILARNAADLDLMINKFIDYEMDPPTNPSFYDNPLICGGWQSDRWFIICADTVWGFHKHGLGKNPVRENAGYTHGSAPSYWSTNQNTQMIIDFFGPLGQGYIPTVPSHLTDWNANATSINAAINSGAFYLLHRDHGSETSWGDPSYSISNMGGLNNDDLTFVMSINCLTGKYDHNPECFAEAMHRSPKRALGLLAASEVSFSFVNDTFVWGVHDSMWPQFDPVYGGSTGDNVLMPGFAHVSGKWYLEASNWPYNTSNKVDTYHLFHMQGDAFLSLYTEVPTGLVVSHGTSIDSTATYFDVTADAGSFIALSAHGEVLGTGTGTGGITTIALTQPPENPGTMYVTVTKPNCNRYEGQVDILVGGPLAMWCPNGTPTERLPGPEDHVTVKIIDGDEIYVPGSGTLHYRFDPADPFDTVALTDLGGNLYDAEIPGCGPKGLPEFYISADGDLGSSVYAPAGAPTTTFSMTLKPLYEIMLFDDMETNSGWTVQSVNLDTGEWELADPQPTDAQPGDDHSPDGTKCWVTGPLAGSGIGSYDVDGGPTTLTSPTFDLSSGDADLSFYLWFHHSSSGTIQPCEIDITNNGVTWQQVADLSNSPGWNLYEYTVSDYVTPTSSVQVRFKVQDQPNDSIVEAALDDFSIQRTVYDATLWCDAYTVSCATGDVIGFGLDAEAANAGRKYLVLGSVSGTMPGFNLPGGMVLPLNWDVFTDFILICLGTPVCQDFLGALDGAGQATASMDTMGSLNPALIGITANFAYVLSSPFDFVSTCIAIDFEP